ncbi:polyphosphate polymerase domain-containing protein [Breznakiella homolactica]|uniref:Polyphosphate polymerase domain-containing protein n=1 Tax=Breznakiella homolactica TaxID=2798577 RepID=A0A7T8BBP0_9SPIR|nr:polyphosphate polymerase domain-containing protein [Breznakiella homolactica]QQO09408.1 polyphosphate polymerase domain-containing protein [Breznakiella homolactica]
MAKLKIASGMVFERHEKKYLLTQAEYEQLLKSLMEYMQQDQYGLHTICSLYYDTEDYLLIRRSLEKPEYKEKLRLRSYGIPKQEDIVFLELKKKLNGITYKRRVPMTLNECEQYFSRGILPEHKGQILNEIEWFKMHYRPAPKVLVFYDRIALCGSADSSLRITFDKNTRWRNDQLTFASGDYGTPLLSPGERLMEIKLNGAFPFWLSHLLSQQKIYPISFSKYGRVYWEILNMKEKRYVG